MCISRQIVREFVAAMLAHVQGRSMTFNEADFRRLSGLIEITNPAGA